MRDYSAGQKKRVLIASSFCHRTHVYIWNEQLNYIDVLSLVQVEGLIVTCQPTMLFVEHDRAFCDNAATPKMNLIKGCEFAQSGTVLSYNIQF